MAESISHQRESIKQVYPKWASKVNKMPDAQVTAIYFSLKQRGKI